MSSCSKHADTWYLVVVEMLLQCEWLLRGIPREQSGRHLVTCLLTSQVTKILGLLGNTNEKHVPHSAVDKGTLFVPFVPCTGNVSSLALVSDTIGLFVPKHASLCRMTEVILHQHSSHFYLSLTFLTSRRTS